MKYLAIFILTFGVLVCSYAQSDNYRQMRDEGIALMRKCNYPGANKMFDGAEGFAVKTSEKTEIKRLQKQLNDSVRSTYNRGIDIAKNAKSSKTYGRAVEELKKLIPSDDLNVYQVYSWLGYCYEHLNEPLGAIDYYQKGVEHNEAFSARNLAPLLQKHKSVPQDSIRRLYERAAPHYKELYDNLGNMYMSSTPLKAYNYFKQSGTNYGKYQIATLLLTKKVSSNYDPIQILQELSDKKYADAQFYLGLLYFHGEHVRQNTEKGLLLINEAKTNGNSDAKQWLIERDKEVKKLKYPYL